MLSSVWLIFVIERVSLTHLVLASFLSGEFLLHIPCWLHFYLGSFSYTSRAGFIFIWGVSLTHPMLAGIFCGDLLLHILCWLFFIYFLIFNFYLGSLSYTSRAGFIFVQGASLTHPVLALLLSAEFLLHIPYWPLFYLGSFSYTSRTSFIFIWGVSLTHPVLPSFLSGEFLLHIPCLLEFSVGSYSLFFFFF